MLLISMLITAVAIGILPGLFKLDKLLSISNMSLAFIGAFTGALIGFGDAPITVRYSFINEITLMIGFSAIFVFSKVLIIRNKKLP